MREDIKFETFEDNFFAMLESISGGVIKPRIHVHRVVALVVPLAIVANSRPAFVLKPIRYAQFMRECVLVNDPCRHQRNDNRRCSQGSMQIPQRARRA